MMPANELKDRPPAPPLPPSEPPPPAGGSFGPLWYDDAPTPIFGRVLVYDGGLWHDPQMGQFESQHSPASLPNQSPLSLDAIKIGPKEVTERFQELFSDSSEHLTSDDCARLRSIATGSDEAAMRLAALGMIQYLAYQDLIPRSEISSTALSIASMMKLEYGVESWGALSIDEQKDVANRVSEVLPSLLTAQAYAEGPDSAGMLLIQIGQL